jgi:glutamine synthetase
MIRFTALQSVNQLKTTAVAHETKKSNILGKYVFSNEKLERYLGKQAYKAFKSVIDAGENITEDLADQIAAAMRTWAMEHGATHYTHWFQPLTGLTAEKHDSFLDIFNGQGIEKFSGGALIQQEPDASSFPNGGIRQTFEARGYTAWDPTSPAFIMQSGGGYTLCIPTIFVSYTGEALDYKAPLLKSVHQLDLAATAVCKYFDENVNKVTATLGVEQEYFLVDAALFNARPDMVIAGRTLLGHSPAKGQQLDDHYFGSIPERVQTFMIDFENECIKLGIPLKTRHNEVAPSQFECAPNFEELNLAVDHNQLLMDVIDKVARRHNFRALLHEKPFANVNGSGKHCNFSMGTNTGVNLLSPGKTPTRNLSFLTFFVNVIKAVSNHNALMRASIASVGNDHRLGANEAPPAIISVFVGAQLSKVLNSLKNDDLEAHVDESEGVIEINAPQIPDLTKDNTDRNRTSPFAFTGNKFEFRAVGSTSNTSAPMTVLATAVADQLVTFKEEVDAKIANGESSNLAILSVLQQYISDSEAVLFEGNNYSQEWENEAAKRGLSNFKTTPLALDAYESESTKALFTKLGVMTEREVQARHEILLESYTNKLQIESRLLGELAMTHVIPASVKYLNELIDSLAKLKTLGIDANTGAMEESVSEITNHISSIKKNVREMIEERKKANVLEEVRDKAIAYCDNVKPYFDTIRYHADKLELLVDDNYWQLPKYRELLFLR